MKPLRQMAVLSLVTSVATLALKFIAYFLTGSVGLLSDALESLVNLAAGLTAFAALTIAEQPADSRHSYGHDKAEYFACGVEGALILVAALAIIHSAGVRFMRPAMLTHLGPGLVVSVVAAAMNYAAARVMLKVAGKYDSVTIEADARHLLTDVWTTAGVTGGLIVVLFMPEWAILDPLIALAVSVQIVFTGKDLLHRAIDGLMDVALSPREIERAETLIREQLLPGTNYHALRTRKAGPRRFIEFHLLVPGTMSVSASHALCDRIESSLAEHMRKSSITIHVEPTESHASHSPTP
jgi:cation diffusion facilitator family transporter